MDSKYRLTKVSYLRFSMNWRVVKLILVKVKMSLCEYHCVHILISSRHIAQY